MNAIDSTTLNQVNNQDEEALFSNFCQACKENQIEEVEKFLSNSQMAEIMKKKEGLFPFASLCDQDHQKVACALLCHKVEDKFFFPTLLLEKIEAQQSLILLAFSNKAPKTVMQLCERNKEIRWINEKACMEDDINPLHFAAQYNSPRLIQLVHQIFPISEKTTCLNKKTKKQRLTPLHIASRCLGPTSIIPMRTLLELGANPNEKNLEGMTALDIVCERGKRIIGIYQQECSSHQISEKTKLEILSIRDALLLLLYFKGSISEMKDTPSFVELFFFLCQIESTYQNSGLEELPLLLPLDFEFLYDCLMAASETCCFNVAKPLLDRLAEAPNLVRPDGRNFLAIPETANGLNPLHYLWRDYQTLEKALRLFPEWVNQISQTYPIPPILHALLISAQEESSLPPPIISLFREKGANFNQYNPRDLKKLTAAKFLELVPKRPSKAKRKLSLLGSTEQ